MTLSDVLTARCRLSTTVDAGLKSGSCPASTLLLTSQFFGGLDLVIELVTIFKALSVSSCNALAACCRLTSAINARFKSCPCPRPTAAGRSGVPQAQLLLRLHRKRPSTAQGRRGCAVRRLSGHYQLPRKHCSVHGLRDCTALGMSIQALLLLRPLRKRLGIVRRFDVQGFYTCAHHRRLPDIRAQRVGLRGCIGFGSPALRLQRRGWSSTRL